MAGREIAHGEVVIGVDLEKIGAELRSAEARFAQAMGNIDRMEAEAQVSINTTRLKKDIAEVKAQLLYMEQNEAEVKVHLDDEAFQAEKKRLQAELKKLNQEKLELSVDASELRDANKELATAEKRVKKLSDAEREREKEREAHQERMKSLFEPTTRLVQEEEAARERIHQIDRKRLLDYNKALKFEEEMEAAAARRANAAERESDRVQRDGARMHRIHAEALQMDKDRAEQVARYRIELGKALTKQNNLNTSLARAVGLSPEKDLELDRVNAQVAKLRHNLRRLGGDEKGLKGVFDEDASHRVRKMVSSLGSIRLQMGFFSATLRQAALGFSALGPIIFGVMGQLIALVGVLGTSLVGAFGVATAAAAGFGLTALGQFFILKPLVGELADATKASTAYGDAVRKYGKNSDQAKDKMEQLNNTLGDIGPRSKEAFVAFGTIGDRWAKLTKGTRTTFFDSMAKGMNAINKVMPTFARESVKAFNASADATDEWTTALSSPKSISNIQQMMSAFTGSLPSINAGLMSIGELMANIGVSAGKYLPELMQGFAQWSKNLLEGVGSGGELDAKMGRLVDHMQELGHFLQAAGSMIATFFNAGANGGADLLQTLTQLSVRWENWMRSASGQEGLSTFFDQANQIGSAFVGTLANIGVALFELSTALTPLSQGFVAVIGAAAKLSAVLLSFKGAQQAVTAIGGALAGAFLASKLVAAAQGVMALVAAMRALATASAAASVAGALNPYVALGAVIGGAIALFMALRDSTSAADASLQAVANSALAVKNAIAAMNGNSVTTASAGIQLAAAKQQEAVAQKNLNAMIKEHGANSRQARDAEQALTQATSSRQQAALSLNQAITTSNKNYAQAIKRVSEEEKTLNDSTEEKADQLREVQEAYRKGMVGIDTVRKAEAELRTEQQKHVKVLKQLENLNNAQAKADLNVARAQAGQAAVLGKVGAKWRALRKELPAEGQAAIAEIVRPADAARAINLTEKLRQMGKLGKANKILVNTKDIDEAISKLRALERRSDNKTQKVKVDADVTAAQQRVNQTRGAFGRGKPSKIKVDADTSAADKKVAQTKNRKNKTEIKVTADGSQAQQTIARLAGRKLPPKQIKIVGNAGDAASKLSKIQNTKLNDKDFKISVDDGEAEAAKRFVDTIPQNTTKNLTMAAEYSALQNAKSYLSSIQSKTVTLTINTVRTGSRAAGGPVPSAAGGAAFGPARQSFIERQQERANSKQNRGGVYKRPTLLVGEENQDEFVIATNPAYRTANVGYLAAAANKFGFGLTSAAKGKSAAQYGRTRTGYDYIRSEIDRLTGLSSNRDADRQADLTSGRSPSYTLDQVIGPLEQVLSPWYTRLQKNLGKRMTKAARVANRKQKSLPGLSKQLAAAKKQVSAIQKQKPDSDKGRAARDKALREAERKRDKLQTARDNAKQAVQSRGDAAGALYREKRGLANEIAGVKTQIQSIKDDEAERGPTGGPGGDVPLGIQMASFDKDRYDAFNAFASNLTGSRGAPPPAMNAPATPTFYSGNADRIGANPASMGGSNGGSSGGATGRAVTQNITITEAPSDPHTFTRQLGWEAQMVGV